MQGILRDELINRLCKNIFENPAMLKTVGVECVMLKFWFSKNCLLPTRRTEYKAGRIYVQCALHAGISIVQHTVELRYKVCRCLFVSVKNCL